MKNAAAPDSTATASAGTAPTTAMPESSAAAPAATAIASMTPAELLTEYARLEGSHQQLQTENDFLRAQFKLAQQKLYGSSSERTDPATTAGDTLFSDALLSDSLFNEAEAQADPELPEPTVEAITAKPVRRKTRGQRDAQLADLSVEEVRYELAAEEQVCPQCTGALHEMGQDVRRELKIIPARAELVEHIRVKYACRHCALHDTSVPILTAPMPAPAFPGSLASPSAVASIMNQKFEMALPLYRLEQSFSDLGINLSRQTMANWVIRGAGLLEPVFNRLHELLVIRDVLHADETGVQVLNEPGRKATSESRMWVYCSGRHELVESLESTGRDGPEGHNELEEPKAPGIVLYNYQPTRGAQHPIDFLQGFDGFLHVDGYVAYEKVPGIKLVGCWAHGRRKFTDAIKTLPPVSRAGVPSAARIGLDFCNRLFKVESELRGATPTQRHARRQEESALIVSEMRTWLEAQAAGVIPKSHLGQAVGYCLHQWPKLTAFLQDGRLELDNNRCERAVKPFVIGRKNWLFANTPKGANASAIVYSIVETARENNLRPLDYLTLLFERLPNLEPGAGLDELLPWADDVQARCGSGAIKTS